MGGGARNAGADGPVEEDEDDDEPSMTELRKELADTAATTDGDAADAALFSDDA